MSNNITYLQNLAAGKTSTGGQATAGNIAWAKAQLAAAPNTATQNTSTQLSSAQNKASQTATNTTTTNSTPAPGSQASHQAWINNPNSGQGGLDAYTTRQNDRYTQAVQSGDTSLINSLNADAQRVGYQLSAPSNASPIIATQSSNNSHSYIDSLTDARKNQKLADLGKARDASLSNLANEKSSIQPKYYDARNQAAAGSQQQARNFAEFMAARGGTNSGTNAQAELTRGMTLQGNLGSLGRQETQAYTDIERRTSDLQNAYQSDIVSTNAGLEADRMQAMLNDYYQQQQRELQIAQLMGSFNGNQTLAGLQNSQQFGLQQGQITGNYQGAPTLAAQNQQFNQNLATQQLNRSNFESDRQYNYAVGQQEWENNFKQGQFDWNKAQTAFENAFKEKSFQQSVKEAAASRGLQWESLTQRDKEFIAQEAWNREKFDYQKEQDTIANDLASQKLGGTTTAPTAEDYAKYIDSSFHFGKDFSGNPVVTDKNAVESMILQSGLPNNEMAKLYARYGIPMK